MEDEILFSDDFLDLGEQDHDLLGSSEDEFLEDDDIITEVKITGSEEEYHYAQLVAAELDSGLQLQTLNNSVNALIIIVFLSVVIKILFRIVDEMF